VSKTVSLQTIDGRDYGLDIPAPGNGSSYFLFSLPKAGSTLLMNVMVDVNKTLGIPMIDLPTRLFTLGITPNDLKEDINQLWLANGYAYMGFRSFLPPMSFDFLKTKNILLIRDPRDILVSLYFSVRFSHRIPKLEGAEHPMANTRRKLQKMGIDQYVLNAAPTVMRNYLAYSQHLPTETTRVYRYEDIVFRKREWLEDMLDFLDLKLSKSRIREIVDKHDIRPGVEDPTKHVRQVTPGNYNHHLDRVTVDKLDEILEPVLHTYQYDSVVSFGIGTDPGMKSIQNSPEPLDLKDLKIRRLEDNIERILQSWSWRSTGFFRWLASFFVKG